MTVHFPGAHDSTVIVRSAKINEWKLAYKDRNREILLDLVASCFYYFVTAIDLRVNSLCSFCFLFLLFSLNLVYVKCWNGVL